MSERPGPRLEILPVYGIGDVVPGDDLAALIASAAPWLRAGDVLVVTSKIVSKAEGRLVDVPADGPDRAAVREAALLAETARPVARRGQTRIVQTHHGFVMASAGIDASNVDRERLVLLPKDPDASARSLRAALRERHGLDVAIIVSDTMGRPWRNGLTDVALGAAGIGPIRDHRGEVDPYGNELHITQMAVVDELAGAAELVKGKCDGVPVAVVRGYLTATAADDGPGVVAELVRSADQDLFPLGSAEARADGLRAAALLRDPAQSGSARASTAATGPSSPTPPRSARASASATGPSSPTPPRSAGGSASATGPSSPTPTRSARASAAATGPSSPIPPGSARASAAATGPSSPTGGSAAGDVSAAIGRALASVAELLADGTDTGVVDGRVVCRAPGGEAEALIRFGADVHRVRAALAAEGLPTALTLTADTTPPTAVLTP